MFKDRLLTTTLILILIIATGHILALNFYLYWSFKWFDLPVHFLGGMWVALTSLWLCFYSRTKRFKETKRNIFVISVVSAIVIGLLWELFELTVRAPRAENFLRDTTGDLIMDMLGAVSGYIYYTKFFFEKNKNIDSNI